MTETTSENPFSRSDEMSTQNASLSSAHNTSNCSSECLDDATGFECNICFELAQDPVVTLCGHLYCWRCLYKWLRIPTDCHECPVCKDHIEKEKLVPLYGRGKPSSPTTSSQLSPDTDYLPQRPTGLRPATATATPPSANPFIHQGGNGFMGERAAALGVANAMHSVSGATAGIGGLFPFLFNFQVHGFNDATVYGTTSGFPHGFFYSFHGGLAPGFHQQPNTDVGLSYSSVFTFGLIFLAVVFLMSVIW